MDGKPPSPAAHRPWCMQFVRLDPRRAKCTCGASIVHVAETTLRVALNKTHSIELQQIIESALKEIEEWKGNFNGK